MMRIKTAALMACLLMAGGKAAAAQARQAVAEVTALAGKVTLSQADGGVRPLKRGAQLYVGEELMLAENAEASLYYLVEGHHLTVYGPAELRIESEGLEDSLGIISVFHGRLSVLWKRLLDRRPRWTLETPSAVVGVRGTSFELAVSEDGATMVAVHEGEVELEGGGARRGLRAGEESEVELGGRPGRARRFTAGDRGRSKIWRRARRENLAGRAAPGMGLIGKRLRSHEAELRKNKMVLGTLLGKQLPRQLESGRTALRKGDRRGALKTGSSLQRSLKEARDRYARIQRLRRRGRQLYRTASYLAAADPDGAGERRRELRGLAAREEMLAKLEDAAREEYLRVREQVRGQRQLLDDLERREKDEREKKRFRQGR